MIVLLPVVVGRGGETLMTPLTLYDFIFINNTKMVRSKGILLGCITVLVLFAFDSFLIDAFSNVSPLVKRQHYSSLNILFAKSGTKKKKVKDSTITVNRNAYRNYEILETFEAGISLVGTEVKSIRDGKMNIRDGFCRPDRRGTCTLHNVSSEL